MKWLYLSVFALLSLLLALFFGAASLSFSDAFDCLLQTCEKPTNTVIFWDIRLPRVIIGFLVGAGLSIAGATLQSVTRNALADPYLFGVVSGAGLGASIAILILPGLPDNSLLAQLSLPVAAFCGALFAVVLVQLISIAGFAKRMEQLLLAGVAVSFMLSAISQFILYLGEPAAATQVVFWLMGSLARAELWYAWWLLAVIVVCSTVLLLFGKQFDALLMGDDKAKTLGVNVRVLRFISLIICAALTACIVAYCGGIGFVGLMIPHIVRAWLGRTFRSVIIGCVLLGGSFLVWVDVLARTVLAGQEVPIGIITAAIGGGFFIIAMYKTNQYGNR